MLIHDNITSELQTSQSKVAAVLFTGNRSALNKLNNIYYSISTKEMLIVYMSLT